MKIADQRDCLEKLTTELSDAAHDDSRIETDVRWPRSLQ